MDQPRLDEATCQSRPQGAERQFIFQRSVQRPADDAARVSVQDDSQEYELVTEPDVGDVRHPQLIGARQDHVSRQVGVDLAFVVGVGGSHEFPPAHAQQVVLPHETAYPFGIHHPAVPTQLLGDPRPTIAGPLHGDLLNRVA